MSKIPQQPPPAGGMTPLSPGKGDISSSKSETESLRNEEMSTSSKSSIPHKKASGNITLKMWGNDKLGKVMSQGATASHIRNLKNAFNQISE